MSKNNNIKPYLGVFLGILIGGLGTFLIIPNVDNNPKSSDENKEVKNNEIKESPLAKITTDISSVSSVTDNIKKGDILLDISDARNYVDQKIPSKYPEIKNMYYTSIDFIKWQMYTYPDVEAINSHSEDILVSTFCIANTIEQKDIIHVHKILDLLINWDYTYKKAYTNINTYLNANFNMVVPDLSNVKKLCSIFNQYPIETFGFLYEGDLKNEFRK